jgi:hypothetical protein
MTTTKPLNATAVTVGIWIAAVGSAAALTYDLNRTSHLTSDAAQLAAPSHMAPALLAQPVSESQPELYVPSITIVGRSHRPSVASRRSE